MNWMSNKPFPGPRFFDDDRNEGCEHVEADHALGYMVQCEDDSFGPLIRRAVCKACFDSDRESELNEIERCRDCRRDFKVKDMRHWRPYDFYPPQGDEPTPICYTCWDLPRHQERIRRDDEDRAWEDDARASYNDAHEED